jgi:hypothetical protein
LSGPACFEQGRPELRVSLVALRLTEAAQRRDSRRSLEGGGIVEQSEDLLEAGLGVAQRAGLQRLFGSDQAVAHRSGHPIAVGAGLAEVVGQGHHIVGSELLNRLAHPAVETPPTGR